MINRMLQSLTYETNRRLATCISCEITTRVRSFIFHLPPLYHKCSRRTHNFLKYDVEDILYKVVSPSLPVYGNVQVKPKACVAFYQTDDNNRSIVWK